MEMIRNNRIKPCIFSHCNRMTMFFSYIYMTFQTPFLQGLVPTGTVVSNEKIILVYLPIRNKNCLWSPRFLSNQNWPISNKYAYIYHFSCQIKIKWLIIVEVLQHIIPAKLSPNWSSSFREVNKRRPDDK